LSTAVLRAGLVIGAIVLGIFVLSKAFPSAQDSTPPVSEDTAAPDETETEDQTPAGDGQGGNDGGGNQPQQDETPDVKGVKVSVLNGAGITDLADCVSKEIVAKLGFKVGEVANAEAEYETTTIFFTKDLRDAAEYLKAEGLPKAQLQPAAQGAFADLVVNLGQDAAAGPCENP
jgi:hypothetical protein